jgi:putative aldouronate transport system permease protein
MAVVQANKIKVKTMIQKSVGEYVLDLINYISLILLAASCLFPFVHLIARSFSAEPAINAGVVLFWPVRPHLLAYKAVFTSISIKNAFWFTIQLTILGTLTNLLMTMLAAYPLSKPNLVFHKGFWMFIIFDSTAITQLET